MTQLIYGMHAITAALDNKQITISEIILTDTRHGPKLEALLQQAKQRRLPIRQLNRRELDNLLPDVNHQGIAARVSYPENNFTEHEVKLWIEQADKPVLLLILDGIQDPHNLGACLRTADAAGVTAVIAPKDKAVALTPTVRKVACGAAETVPFIQVTNLSRFIQQIQQLGVWCYGLAGEAQKTIFDMDLRGHIALVLGAEEKGLRQLTRECCDDLIAIPMAGSVESLNVSVATGISLFEAVRQRQTN
jgi:23S rRNA (guanosine2251-2'-O)-methyltransferase